MKDFYLQIWANGEPVENATIVSVSENNYMEPPFIEPGPTLNELEYILEFVKAQFPDGWQIINGKICSV